MLYVLEVVTKKSKKREIFTQEALEKFGNRIKTVVCGQINMRLIDRLKKFLRETQEHYPNPSRSDTSDFVYHEDTQKVRDRRAERVREGLKKIKDE